MLSILLHDSPVITIVGRWLYPLFAVRRALRECSPTSQVPDLSLYAATDTVVGAAAIVLYCAIGIRDVKASLASTPAWERARREGIRLSADKTVAQIACSTEAQLSQVADSGAALALLDSRINPIVYAEPRAYAVVTFSRDDALAAAITQYLGEESR